MRRFKTLTLHSFFLFSIHFRKKFHQSENSPFPSPPISVHFTCYVCVALLYVYVMCYVLCVYVMCCVCYVCIVCVVCVCYVLCVVCVCYVLCVVCCVCMLCVVYVTCVWCVCVCYVLSVMCCVCYVICVWLCVMCCPIRFLIRAPVCSHFFIVCSDWLLSDVWTTDLFLHQSAGSVATAEGRDRCRHQSGSRLSPTISKYLLSIYIRTSQSGIADR